MSSSGGALLETSDGYVAGDPSALELVRFADNWANYDIRDVPERVSPERVQAALDAVFGRARVNTPKTRRS